MDVTISKSVFSRRRNVGPPRRAKAEEVISNVDLDTYNLARMKYDPGDYIFNEVVRPINAVCHSCVVNSQAVIHRNYLALGSHSCFHLESMGKSNPFYVRIMPEIFHYIRLPNVFVGLKGLTPEEIRITANSLLKDGSYKLPSREDYPELQLVKAQRFLQLFEWSRISSVLTNFYTKIASWIFGKLLSFGFESVCVHFGEMEMVRTAMDSGLPIVFVPLHRSHMDPFLICWTLYIQGFRPPQFIAPHSLIHTPVLGWLAKMFGGLGCKQRRDTSDLGYLSKDVNMSLLVYMNLLWSNGNSVAIPVEPHRSRTGKPSANLVGREFFNTLLKLYDTREIEDAFVIPVSVNYEVLPEEDLITIQNGAVSKPGFFKWVSRFIRNLGFARVSFSQPFRLREFKLDRSKITPVYVSDDWENLPLTEKATSILPGSEFNWIEDFGSVASLSSIYGETDCMEPAPGDESKTNALLDHSFFDATKTTVIMSTHMVAFLLLKKFKQGVEMNEFVSEFEILETELRSIHKYDLGFTADVAQDAVERGISLLGSDCIKKYNMDKNIWLKPDSRKSSLIKLNYYANHVMPLFVMRGIAAVGIVNVTGPSIWTYADFTFVRGKPITVEESDVINKAVQISELMKSEFLLHPPCKNTTGIVSETLEKMKDFGDLQFDVTKRIYQDEEDLYEYDYYASDGDLNPIASKPPSLRIIINNCSEALNKLKFHRSLIIPYLELYGEATQYLKILIPLPLTSSSADKSAQSPAFLGVEDSHLRKHIYSGLEARFQLGFFKNEELLTMDYIRNFLYTMENIGVLRFYAGVDTKWLKMYYLVSEYEKPYALDALSATIIGFSV